MSHGPYSLEGKCVVVTGAARGIGRSIAVAFANAGARLALVDSEAEGLSGFGFELGDGHLPLAANLADISVHDALMEAAGKRLGNIDALVHAAGVLVRRELVDDVSESDWDIQHDVNLKATFFLNRSAANVMRRQGRGGRIVNFASQAWWSGGFGGSVAYAASKGGVVSLTRGLARTYAPDRITVNVIAPGAIDTEMMRSGLKPEQLNAQLSQIPMGHMGSPDDVAGAALFLASEGASYITGATINVSGGWLMY